MDNENSLTMEQQSGAENQETAPVEGADQPSNQEARSGAEERIGELTRKYREAEREREAERQRNSELTRLVSELARKHAAPQEPAPEFDPDERKKFEYLLSPVQQELMMTRRQLASLTAAQELATVVDKDTPPEVSTEARNILAEWRAKGYNGGAEEALSFALGKHILKQRNVSQASDSQRRDFNRGASAVQTGGAAPVARQQGNRRLSEAEVEKLPVQEQARYWREQVGDKEWED